MAKRTKYVFSSHSQLCHVWAQQTQESGKSSSMFFKDTHTMYSWGTHYKAAKVWHHKGKTFALINADRYSVSTANHLSEIRSALRGLMPYFESPDVESLSACRAYLDSLPGIEEKRVLKRMKVTSSRDVVHALERIDELYRDANEFRVDRLGLKSIEQKIVTRHAIEDHFAKRLKRYHELNTPEAIAKRDIEREKRNKRKNELLLEALQEDIKQFRLNGYAPRSMYSISPELLYLDQSKNTVVTSRGASVPSRHAFRLLNLIRNAKGENTFEAINGEKIGHFKVDCLIATDNPDNPIIKIGCHRIALLEAENVLGNALGNLSLVHD